MNAQPGYTFRPVTMGDIGLLTKWQAHHHVRAWWGPSEPYNHAKLADPRVARWIVLANDRPFGFMQDYDVHGWTDHHFAHLPKGSRGIDQYIGEPDMIGKGHGPSLIGIRMRALFDQAVPVIATDPHPENHRAIAVYKKLGFAVAGRPQKTEWGLILPMQATR